MPVWLPCPASMASKCLPSMWLPSLASMWWLPCLASKCPCGFHVWLLCVASKYLPGFHVWLLSVWLLCGFYVASMWLPSLASMWWLLSISLASMSGF